MSLCELIFKCAKQKSNFYFQNYNILMIFYVSFPWFWLIFLLHHEYGSGSGRPNDADPDPHHWLSCSTTFNLLSIAGIFLWYFFLSRTNLPTIATLSSWWVTFPSSNECFVDMARREFKLWKRRNNWVDAEHYYTESEQLYSHWIILQGIQIHSFSSYFYYKYSPANWFHVMYVIYLSYMNTIFHLYYVHILR